MQAIAIALAASLMTYVIMRGGGRGSVVIAVLVASALFLLLGQAVPRALARTRPSATAGALLTLARFVAMLIRPLSALSDSTADLSPDFSAASIPTPFPPGPKRSCWSSPGTTTTMVSSNPKSAR